MIGHERTILPKLAEVEFHMVAKTAILSFIVVFGFTKAFTNYLAGRLSDHYGRKKILILGWLFAIPVPFLLMWAPSWNWILIANLFLGISQGLTWSITVIMKIDLVGPKKRSFAMVYPTLLATIGADAHPQWRASAVGIYRLWRDSGYAIGAIIAGIVADAFGIHDLM